MELMNLGLQRRTDLALQALSCLAEFGTGAPGVGMAGADLAGRIGTTVTFLPQVMAPLIRAGWVSSERGPGGGYRLTESSWDASLLDVVEATEGPSDDGRCALRDVPCPGRVLCPIHAVWVQAREVLTQGLGQIPAIPIQGATR